MGTDHHNRPWKNKNEASNERTPNQASSTPTASRCLGCHPRLHRERRSAPRSPFPDGTPRPHDGQEDQPVSLSRRAASQEAGGDVHHPGLPEVFFPLGSSRAAGLLSLSLVVGHVTYIPGPKAYQGFSLTWALLVRRVRFLIDPSWHQYTAHRGWLAHKSNVVRLLGLRLNSRYPRAGSRRSMVVLKLGPILATITANT